MVWIDEIYKLVLLQYYIYAFNIHNDDLIDVEVKPHDSIAPLQQLTRDYSVSVCVLQVGVCSPWI